MSNILRLASVEDTELWKMLDEGFAESPQEALARELAVDTQSLCKEAAERMKSFPSLHPQYTLHDETHLLRVTELMARIMPASVKERLNPVEVALLILSAYFHDQGMVPERGELNILKSDSKFIIHRSNWIIDHPNFKEIQEGLRNENLSDKERERYRQLEQELNNALITDYIRETHAKRSADIIQELYKDDGRLAVARTNLGELLARLCISHNQSPESLVPTSGFRHDELVGIYKINMAYLGVILRLADILDLDRDRTPDVLYKSIHFSSPLSLSEWEKHRSVDGWDISSSSVRFAMRCEHPTYQKAALQFMDWIDDELASCNDLVRDFPNEFSSYRLELPARTDRSRIEPKNNAYIYHDLQFTMSRDEIVKLLMTEELYGSPALAVRELLQNALDALRHRKALYKSEGLVWTAGNVDFKHYVDSSGHEVVSCTDNGVGMTEKIVTRFLTNAGRSYYRSPEFERERIGFREADADFDPCAQFGIGFMSSFMLGDRIKILTRRDNGPEQGRGVPLVVEINGLGGIVMIQKGSSEQPVGTTVEITGRRKPSFLDEWTDRVHLIDVIDGYALATEFPIKATCSIPEIRAATDVPNTSNTQPTVFERANLRKIVTLEQHFSDIDERLGGSVRVSLLVDEHNKFVTSNNEAAWLQSTEQRQGWLAVIPGYVPHIDFHWEFGGQTCQDGILVCGRPGRNRVIRSVGARGNVIYLGGHNASNTSFLLDARGSLKPPLSPARTPIDRFTLDRSPKWQYLNMLAKLALGRIWTLISQGIGEKLDIETFWHLLVLYEAETSSMKLNSIWENLAIPLARQGQNYEWTPLQSLDNFVIEARREQEAQFVFSDSRYLVYPDVLKEWRDNNNWTPISYMLRDVVQSIASFAVEGNKSYLHISAYQDNLAPIERALRTQRTHIKTLPFLGAAANALAASTPMKVANSTHPLVSLAIKAQYLEQPTAIEDFALRITSFAVDSDIYQKSHKLLGADDYPVTYWMHRIGHAYKALDWSNVNKELHPPYTGWVEGHGFVQIDAPDFIYWAETEPLDR